MHPFQSLSRRGFLPRPLLLGLVALTAPVLAAQESEAGARMALEQRIDAAVQALGPHATSAVRVVSLDTGEVLYERNADLSLNPASNMKLLTSAAALGILGPNYRFQTRVALRGRLAGGRLKGDLALIGGGDPVLETEDLAALADAVRKAGIRRVEGRLVVDESRYDAERLGIGWQSDDEPYYYSAQISGLSVNRNVLTVQVRPGKKAGQPPVIELAPVPGHLKVTSSLTTVAAGAGTDVDITRRRGHNELLISGRIAVDSGPVRETAVTMEEPALFTGALFRRLLAARGVVVEGSTVRGKTGAEWRQVARRDSPPLSEIVVALNKPSDNLVAEMLLKELGYQRKQPGDATTGSTVVEEWLKGLGIAVSGVRVNDGSGLSRMDLVTARAISDLLVKADKQAWREIFIHSLPVAGVDGTLRRRLKDTPAEGNLRAKTGTLSHVTALGGYVTTAGKERLAFSILINNYPGPASGPEGSKRIEDRIAVTLAEWERPKPAN